MIKNLSVLLLASGFWLLASGPIHAQVSIGDQLKLNETSPVKCSPLSTPGGIISTILPNLFILAGFILFLYFIFGGFMLITSHGDPEKTGKGKQAITGAIMGFIVIFTSFWIVQIIEILTGLNLMNALIPGLSETPCLPYLP